MDTIPTNTTFIKGNIIYNYKYGKVFLLYWIDETTLLDNFDEWGLLLITWKDLNSVLKTEPESVILLDSLGRKKII